MKNEGRLSTSWKFFLLVSAVAGVILRLAYVEDMEFKEDEHYNFIKTRLIGISEPWPWFGMPSGAYVPNPGMSIWVFVILARIARATEPTELARALQIFSLLGITLLIPFALRFVQEQYRKIWLWAFALAMVNPFAVYYQRKLWPEPFLPFFSMLFLMGWWRRDRVWGALTWGFIGAILGQIHMSGFFFAGGFFLWTIFFERKLERSGQKTKWRPWSLASLAGALPLIPWVLQLLTRGSGVPGNAQVNRGWVEIQQLKFWVFWLTDSLGFHLGNPLGILRGPSHWHQLSDFIRYPLIGGHATYLNAVAHAILLLTGISILLLLLKRLPRLRPATLIGTGSQQAFAVSAGLWGFGILLTLTGVMIRRYYMMVSFPLEFVWLAGLFLPSNATVISERRLKIGTWLLMILWAAQLFVSANLVGYVHVNEGSLFGDYGAAFHVIKRNNLKSTGKPWPERPAI